MGRFGKTTKTTAATGNVAESSSQGGAWIWDAAKGEAVWTPGATPNPVQPGQVNEGQPERGDPWEQLGRWTPAQRKDSQELLKAVNLLPANYNAQGQLENKFVSAWNKYMNTREAGLETPLNWQTLENEFGVDVSTLGGTGAVGGGRGRAAPAPTFGVGNLRSSSRDQLEDRLAIMYEGWTGAIPDAPSLEFVTNMALGGKSQFDVRSNVMATPEFRSRFRQMPAGMDVQEYDNATIDLNARAFKHAGRKANDQELQDWFAGNGQAVFDSFRGNTGGTDG